MSRRLLIAALLGILLFATPALAGLSITDRQQATTDLITGPQFYAFGTGTDLTVGTSTSWAGFALERLQIDGTTGDLVLGRDGDVDPSATTWHEPSATTRACESAAASGVRSLTFDVQREIDAGRLRSDLADIRIYDIADGNPVPFRTGSPDATSVVVDTTGTTEPASVCVYWGSGAATSLSDSSVQGPVSADGGWSLRTWNDVGDGLSLDLVDWSTPTATGAVATAAAPADVCNQCSNELVGFVTPSTSGSYQFFLSADEVGRLEIAPLDDPGWPRHHRRTHRRHSSGRLHRSVAGFGADRSCRRSGLCHPGSLEGSRGSRSPPDRLVSRRRPASHHHHRGSE